MNKTFKTGKPVYANSEGLKLILYSGLRTSEATALRWDNVDLPAKTIYICENTVFVKNRSETDHSKQQGGHYVQQNSAKTVSGDRPLYLNQKCLDALNTLKSENTMNSEFVLHNAMGAATTPQTMLRTFNKVLENCGIKKSGVHSLRHTFASMLFRHGIDVNTVSKILGHKSVQITNDIYIHIIKQQQLRAVELLDEFDE